VGRYTGPTEKLSRREGVELELKGARRLARKGGLERRGDAPPGQHGAGRFRRRESIYGQQLREKQRAKRYYGVREKQFRNYVVKARKGREGQLGERLMVLLERRLDNVVYRLGLATTRAQARQFVGHGHVTVNGRRVDIASFLVSIDDVISIKLESPIRPAAIEATELIGRVTPWLQADFDGLTGKVLRFPERNEIDAPVNEQLIVELYSRSM
jgi:small subunit ribosomal protein S4